MKTESRASYMRLERRELLILEAKRHALKKIAEEYTDLHYQYFMNSHDDDKIQEKIAWHLKLLKDAYLDYCDQKARVDEMVQLQQVKQE